MTKVFDKINHLKLLEKLLNIGVLMYIIIILCNIFSSQTSHVVFNSTSSNSFNIRNGVCQGGILSPLLFNLYIDDILDHIPNFNVG